MHWLTEAVPKENFMARRGYAIAPRRGQLRVIRVIAVQSALGLAVAFGTVTDAGVEGRSNASRAGWSIRGRYATSIRPGPFSLFRSVRTEMPSSSAVRVRLFFVTASAR